MYSLKDVQKDVHREIDRDFRSRYMYEIKCMLFMGLAEEAGEVAGLGKRMIRGYDKDIQRFTMTNIAEELGDVLWYLAGVADTFGLSLDDIWKQNRDKLEARYGSTGK